MVTPQGFNALLKIVEEPPEHVKFVFATTEPEKVIGTIRSRTHHYPFRLVPPARLQAYMEELCAKEGVAVAPGVLSFVVRAGGGSVRDSLSVLDQLIAGSGPDGLTYESAAALLGFTDGELLDGAIDALAAGDAGAVFRTIDKVVETGLDPRRFVEDLLERLRDLIVVAAVTDGAGQVLRHLPEDQLERMRRQSAAFGPGALSRAADVVNAGLTEMTGATAPRLQLELIAARVLLPGAAGEAGYAARLDRLERRLDVGGVPTQACRMPRRRPPRRRHPPLLPWLRRRRAGTCRTAGRAAAPAQPTAPEPPTAEPAPARASHGPPGARRTPRRPPTRSAAAAPAPPAATTPEPPPAPAPKGPGGLDTDALRRSWPDVLEWLSRHKRVTWTFVSQNAQVADYDGTRVLLGISTVGLAETFRRGAHADYVRQALIDVLGVDARVEGVPMEDAGAAARAAAPPAPAPAPGRGPRGRARRPVLLDPSGRPRTSTSEPSSPSAPTRASPPPGDDRGSGRASGIRLHPRGRRAAQLVRGAPAARQRAVVGEPARAGPGRGRRGARGDARGARRRRHRGERRRRVAR